MNTVASFPISNFTPGQTKHSPSVLKRPRQRSFSHIQRAIRGMYPGSSMLCVRAKRQSASGPPLSGGGWERTSSGTSRLRFGETVEATRGS